MSSVQQSRENYFAEELRGFGPIGIVAIILILLTGNIMLKPMWTLPIGALLVLLWVYLSKTPWHELGFVRVNNWLVTIGIGLVIGIVLKLFMKTILMPLLGAPAVNNAYHFISGNPAVLPSAIWAMLMAGFGEETVFRGWMFERLGKLLGKRIAAKIFIVVFTSLWFGIEHYAVQGISGVEQSTIVGLIYGTIMMVRKNIWILMIAHAAFDLTALYIIYFNLETNLAHMFFK